MKRKGERRIKMKRVEKRRENRQEKIRDEESIIK